MPKTGESGSHRGRRIYLSAYSDMHKAEAAKRFDTLWYGSEEAQRRYAARKAAARTKVSDSEIRQMVDSIRQNTGKRKIYTPRKRTRG